MEGWIYAAAAALGVAIEAIRYRSFRRRLDTPLKLQLRKWKTYNKKASSSEAIWSMYRYACHRLGLEQLRHYRIIVEGEKSPQFASRLFEYVALLLLPALAFIYQYFATGMDRMESIPFSALVNPLLYAASCSIVIMGISTLFKRSKIKLVKQMLALTNQLLQSDALPQELFRSGTELLSQDDFRQAAYFGIPIVVTGEQDDVHRGVIRKTSVVSISLEQGSFEIDKHRFVVL